MLKDYNSSIEYEDADTSSYSSKSREKTKKEIVMDIFYDCLKMGSLTRTKDGNVVMFCDKVQMLRIAILPDLKTSKDKDVLEYIGKYEEGIKSSKDEREKKIKELKQGGDNKWSLQTRDKHNEKIKRMEEEEEIKAFKYHEDLLIAISYLLHEHNYYNER